MLLFALGVRARADDISLTLDPVGGALTGPAGSTVGWGFPLANSGSGFAVISGSDFCVGPITSPCSTSFGTYTDFIGQQFIVVGSSSVTEAFDNNTQTGLGSFFINPASTGTVTGLAVVFYDLFSVDPNSPDFNPISTPSLTGTFSAPTPLSPSVPPPPQPLSPEASCSSPPASLRSSLLNYFWDQKARCSR